MLTHARTLEPTGPLFWGVVGMRWRRPYGCPRRRSTGPPVARASVSRSVGPDPGEPDKVNTAATLPLRTGEENADYTLIERVSFSLTASSTLGGQ
jgi:hypothetical protein